MGLLDLFAGRSLDALLARARQRLATSDFDQAMETVESGLQRYPEAASLREMRLTIRRAQARAGMQSLKDQIRRDDDPLAHEQLIGLYHEVDMPAEARRAAQAYAAAHPDRDTPHLLLGEMLLQAFFEDLQARDAHSAQEHLLRAAQLNADAIKPRLLLAELYFCCGADHALGALADTLARLAPQDEVVAPVIAACREVARPDSREAVESRFAKVEVDGSLRREPTAWPLRTRRNRDQRLLDERMATAAEALVQRGELEEVVVVRRAGALIAHAGGLAPRGARPASPDLNAPPEALPEKGLAGVASSIARGMSRQVREFDLGAFKRCTIEGPFGVIVVGELAGVVAAARHNARREPRWLWERLTVALEGGKP